MTNSNIENTSGIVSHPNLMRLFKGHSEKFKHTEYVWHTRSLQSYKCVSHFSKLLYNLFFNEQYISDLNEGYSSHSQMK